MTDVERNTRVDALALKLRNDNRRYHGIRETAVADDKWRLIVLNLIGYHLADFAAIVADELPEGTTVAIRPDGTLGWLKQAPDAGWRDGIDSVVMFIDTGDPTSLEMPPGCEPLFRVVDAGEDA